MKKLLVAMMTLLFFAIPAQAETTKCKAITKLPYTIEVAGIYCLKKNLTFAASGAPITSGHAIFITSTATGAVLDLNGFTLSGGDAPSTTSATGIDVRAQNAIIRNGTVQNFNVGVYTAATGGIIENLIINNNFSKGIWIQAQQVIVRHNIITDTGGYTGSPNAAAYAIHTDYNDSSIHDNTITEVTGVGSGYGVGISSSTLASRTIVSNNTISDINGTAGIWFQGGSHHIASGNRITKPGNYGIAFGGTGSYMDNLVVGATSNSYNGSGTAAGTTNY